LKHSFDPVFADAVPQAGARLPIPFQS